MKSLGPRLVKASLRCWREPDAQPNWRAIAVAGMALAALLVGGCVTGSPKPEYMLATNPGIGKQIAGVLSGKTVIVGEVTGERPQAQRPLRNSFWYALVRSVEQSEIFKSVVTNGSSDYRLEAEIVSHREMEASAAYTSILHVNYRLIEVASNRVVWTDNVVSRQDSGIGLASATEAAVRTNLTRMLKEMAEFFKSKPEAKHQGRKDALLCPWRRWPNPVRCSVRSAAIHIGRKIASHAGQSRTCCWRDSPDSVSGMKYAGRSACR